MLVIGGFSSYVLFAVGWIVFGIAGWRSHMFPAWIGMLFVVAGLLGYNAGLPPYGIPIGLVMATLGWWIIRTGAPATPPGGVKRVLRKRAGSGPAQNLTSEKRARQ